MKFLFLMISFFVFRVALASVSLQSCLVCHSQNNSSVPNISGQSRVYLEKQLFDFKFKNRRHNKMNEIAQALSDQDIARLSDYFSNVTWPMTAKADLDMTSIQLGKNLAYQIGCATCHGTNLQGLGKAPRIAGQKNLYIQSQLQAFHSQQRTNDLGQMYSFAQFLTQEDMHHLANFLNSL